MMKAKRNQKLKQLTLILGILVAILAGFHTTVQAKKGHTVTETAITHEEIVDLLAYLWEDDLQNTEESVTIYNEAFELIYQGLLSELDDPQILVNGDVLMKETNHTIYIVQ